MGDVEVGCIVEIKSGATLRRRARQGPGARRRGSRRTRALERMFWTYGLRGRPARMLMEVLAELVDASSVGGASFDLGSATFDMTRIATGQLDAYIEPGPRIVDEVPGAREEFERVGGGAILNNSPYDLAAAVLCLAGGGRGRHRRPRRAARRPAAAGLEPRVPDVLRRRGQRGAARRRSARAVDAGIERLVAARGLTPRLPVAFRA